MPCYSPLKGWRDEESGALVFRAEGASATAEVACGQCLGCRLDRSRMWAMRIVHESSLYECTNGNCFVTLTYRDEYEANDEQLDGGFYIPDDWSLHKDHFQKFMKRLRKAFPDRKIKFFMCGEYGETCKHKVHVDDCEICVLGRPHYHACLFNFSPDDLEQYTQRLGEPRYTSPKVEEIWKYGFVDVGELNFDSAAYVARYILKKVNGVQAEEHYASVSLDGELTFLVPEYCTMSRGGREKGSHGIGYDWYKKFSSDVFPSDECPVPGIGNIKKVPRYYEELFKIEDPLGFDEIKEIREKYRIEHSEEYTPARLKQKYKVKLAQVNLLVRNAQ